MNYWEPVILDTTSCTNKKWCQTHTYKNKIGARKVFMSIKPNQYKEVNRYECYLSSQVINADYFLYGINVILPLAWETTKYEIHFLTNLSQTPGQSNTHDSAFLTFKFVRDGSVYSFHGPDGVVSDVTEDVFQKINSTLINDADGPNGYGVYEFELMIEIKDKEYNLYVNGEKVLTKTTTSKLHYANNNVGFLLVPSMPKLPTTATVSDKGNIGINDMFVKTCSYNVVPIVNKVCIFDDLFVVDTVVAEFPPEDPQ